MIGPDSRVSLARQARLKLDPRTGRQILLYPEKGLDLNDTAARVADLCREERAVRDIVERMVAAAIDSPIARRQIEDEVLAFLRALEDRGLLMVRSP
jgi:coenzyme PQQ biosynthesis protein PqqD